MPSSSFVWQTPGTPWRGVAIYHVTVASPRRHPVRAAFGELRWTVCDGHVEEARVEWSPLGSRIWDCIQQIPVRYPPVRIIAARVMPDHVHIVLHVTEEMSTTFNLVLRGWVQGCKKAARELGLSEEVFADRPFIRVLVGRGQLQTMADYVRLNPFRMAVRQTYPDCFAVQRGVEIAGHTCAAVGNVRLLFAPHLWQVHVHKEWVWDADHGDDQRLRDYQNECILRARRGYVLVSPFINEHEAAVRDVALREQLPVIYLLDNGLPDRSNYKPSGSLTEAVAAGRLLLLSPWDMYAPAKGRCTRAECNFLNALSASIARLSPPL